MVRRPVRVSARRAAALYAAREPTSFVCETQTKFLLALDDFGNATVVQPGRLGNVA